MITRIKAINFLSRQKNQIFQGGSEVFLRKYNLFLKKLFSSFFYLIGSPISLMIFISIRLIQPFYLIRMQQIFSHRLGHHTVDTEIYLLEKGRRENIPKKKYLDIWYNSNTISSKDCVEFSPLLIYPPSNKVAGNFMARYQQYEYCASIPLAYFLVHNVQCPILYDT